MNRLPQLRIYFQALSCSRQEQSLFAAHYTMKTGRKISPKYILALLFTVVFFFVTLKTPANYPGNFHFDKALTSLSDTTKPLRSLKDSVNMIRDTVGRDSV